MHRCAGMEGVACQVDVGCGGGAELLLAGVEPGGGGGGVGLGRWWWMWEVWWGQGPATSSCVKRTRDEELERMSNRAKAADS